MKKAILSLILTGVLNFAFGQSGWCAPIQLLPDSIHVYEIPQQAREEQYSMFMLARVGDSSIVVRLGNGSLDDIGIIAIADTMWSLSTPGYVWGDTMVEITTWRERDCNKLLTFKKTATPSINIYTIPDSFSCISNVEGGYSYPNQFFGITTSGNLTYCTLDTLTGYITGSIILDSLPPAEGYLKYSWRNGTYISSYAPPEFILFDTYYLTFESFSGKNPTFVEHGASIMFIAESPNWDLYTENIASYANWPGGWTTDDSLEEKCLSYFSGLYLTKYFCEDGAAVYAVDGNIILYSVDYSLGAVFDTMVVDANPTYFGATNIIADLNYSWIFWTDSAYVLWGICQTTIIGAISESPSARPENIAISAYPNPFNSAVRISVETLHATSLRIEIFDLAGRRVAQLPSPSVPLPAGEGRNSFSLWEKVSEGRMRAEFTWQPEKSLSSGVYLVRARIDDKSIMKRIVYMK